MIDAGDRTGPADQWEALIPFPRAAVADRDCYVANMAIAPSSRLFYPSKSESRARTSTSSGVRKCVTRSLRDRADRFTRVHIRKRFSRYITYVCRVRCFGVTSRLGCSRYSLSSLDKPCRESRGTSRLPVSKDTETSRRYRRGNDRFSPDERLRITVSIRVRHNGVTSPNCVGSLFAFCSAREAK